MSRPFGDVLVYHADGLDSVRALTYGSRNLFTTHPTCSLKWASPNSWTNPALTPSPLIRTTFGHDNLGSQTRVTRATGEAGVERVVDAIYDGSGRLRRETQYPSWPATSPTLVTQSTYDARNNLVSTQNPLGQTTSYSYDEVSQLIAISYSDGATPSVSYTYDANGNRSTMVDGTGPTTYSYDEVGRLTTVTSPGPSSVGYRYDRGGNRTKLIYPDATAVTYGYDRADRLTSLTDWESRVSTYEYFADGKLSRSVNVGGTVTNYAYDNDRRMTDVWHQVGSNTISRHTYTLDAIGNRRADELLPRVSGPAVSEATIYTYDSLYRLTGASSPTQTTSYTLDSVGNRLTRTRGSTTAYTYDKADRIVAAGGVTYNVNANGNVEQRGSDFFAYDQANRLTLAVVGSGWSSFAYDGDGKRATSTVGSSPPTQYVYDVNRPVTVLLDDGTRKYVYAGELAYSVARPFGDVRVYHADGLGSVRALTYGPGIVSQTYRTDEFGARRRWLRFPADTLQLGPVVGRQRPERVILSPTHHPPPARRFLMTGRHTVNHRIGPHTRYGNISDDFVMTASVV